VGGKRFTLKDRWFEKFDVDFCVHERCIEMMTLVTSGILYGH